MSATNGAAPQVDSPTERQTIELCGKAIPMVAQKSRWLDRHDLDGLLAKFTAGGKDAGGAAWELLAICIPDIADTLPRHVFNGYASEEAEASDDYQPDLDNSPTDQERLEAVFGALMLNRPTWLIQQVRTIGPVMNLLQQMNGPAPS